MTTPHRRPSALVAVLALIVATLFFAPPAEAQSNPYERGPDPTLSLVEGSGPYSTSTSSVSSFVSGFGGGTIYYPTGTNETFGGVVVSPGFTASTSSMAAFSNRVASHGFVVLAIDTNSIFNQPNSRGSQLLAAADWLASSSPPSVVQARLDSNRMAVSGHSMGGGGSLAASNSRDSLLASVPLTAWHTTKTWSSNTVPQMIIGAENDSTASVSSHSIPFYEGLPNSTPKMYVELDGAGHFAPNYTNSDISAMSVSWFKRWVDNDARYNRFLCGEDAPTASSGFFADFSDVRDNCELGWGEGDPGNGDPGDPGEPQCVTATNSQHADAGRAVQPFIYYYAVGSGDFLGFGSSTTSLQQTGDDEWSRVSSC